MVTSSKNEDNSGNSSKQDQAFVLRYTIDAIIADLQGFDRTTNGNQYLPSLADAESMDAVITCVGRTSPTEGTLYDSYGNIIALLEDDGIDLLDNASDGGNSSSSSSSTDLEEDDEVAIDENNDAQTTTDDVAVQKTASVSDTISASSSSSYTSTSTNTPTSSCTALLIAAVVVGLCDFQLAYM